MLLIIIKEEMHQPNALIYLIIIPYFQLSNYTDLAFSYLFKRVIIKKEMIILIIKPVSSKI